MSVSAAAGYGMGIEVRIRGLGVEFRALVVNLGVMYAKHTLLKPLHVHRYWGPKVLSFLISEFLSSLFRTSSLGASP